MIRTCKSIALLAAATFALATASTMAQAQVAGQAQSSQPSPAAVFAAWDVDKSKTLSLEEFNAGWIRLEQVAAARQLKMQFDLRDKDRSGNLDSAEYAALELVRKAGASAPAFASFDTDRTGGIDFREYVAMVATLAGKTRTPASKGRK